MVEFCLWAKKIFKRLLRLVRRFSDSLLSAQSLMARAFSLENSWRK